MSTALHSAPHQSAALASSPLASSANRGYSSPHASPSREAYGAQPTPSSPSSRRPPSRKTSTGAGSSPSVDMSTSRSTRTGASLSSHEHRAPRSERPISMPPVAPPRTSSSAHQVVGSSRRNDAPNEAIQNTSHHASAEAVRSGSRGDPNGYQDPCRSKRAGITYQETARPPSSRGPQGQETVVPIRSASGANSKPTQEASDHLIRVVSGAEAPNGRTHGPPQDDRDAAPPPVVPMDSSTQERRGGRSRHDHSRSTKGTTKFGDFILGNTIGEGEFGKVKLGWKQDSSVQVAIKLIKRDSVGGNPSRLGKIKREVSILRGVHHPNIVRLIDMIETDRYIGIILEYASGGELFDYILNHRYLKDHSARRLFSQLVSGVGYLHKKGIVHRDLKLENLLLDRNRNIIITDFGFANTFDPNEELSEEDELNLGDRESVKRLGLDTIKPNGLRKGDLMQTSCGSPCYAAPELVVSDSLYTGRKVDVWSCGVILYAMLAGYLPFDDDPANPEGDNINLLYKYIVSTPLTFPEYVTPHARDLLRRILVPNPRKRADLFEVARHSWLSEYAHIVEFITSSTTLPSDVQHAANAAHEFGDGHLVTRSASVRETPKQKSPMQVTVVGGLAKAHAKLDSDAEPTYRTPKDAKRRTVQLEYVAPTTQTQRGADPVASRPPVSLNREVNDVRPGSSAREKAFNQDALYRSSQPKRSPSGHAAATSRPREIRATTDNVYMTGTSTATGARPHTGGSMQSAASMTLQTRGNYGQLVPPAVADTNAQGRIQQPVNTGDDDVVGRQSMSVPPKFAQMTGFHEARSSESKGHKRSSTIGDISSRLLGRSGSVFGGRGKKKSEPQPEKTRKYPPISMTNAMAHGDDGVRPSMDSRVSRRSVSLGVGKKRSGSMTGSQGSGEKKERRRFSLLPASFSLKSIGLGREYTEPASSEVDSHTDLPIQPDRHEHARSVTAPGEARGSTPFFDEDVYDGSARQDVAHDRSHRYAPTRVDNRRPDAIPPYIQSGSHFNSGSESSMDTRRPPTEPQAARSVSHGFSDVDSQENRRATSSRGPRGMLQKNHKRFTDAYEQDAYRGHEGSSGAAKRVMDFFRRRGRARGSGDRS